MGRTVVSSSRLPSTRQYTGEEGRGRGADNGTEGDPGVAPATAALPLAGGFVPTKLLTGSTKSFDPVPSSATSFHC